MITSPRIKMRWPRIGLMGISLLATSLPAWGEDGVGLPLTPPAAEARPKPWRMAAERESPKFRDVVRRESLASIAPPNAAVPSDADQLRQRYREQQAVALREIIASLQSMQQRYAAQGQRSQA